jgi:hypothetical protein
MAERRINVQAADEANVKPRVLITVDRGIIEVRSSSELDLTVADSELEVKCDDVFHLCSPEELEERLRCVSSYRHDRFFCQALERGD